jgi:hypothetical protein
MEHSIDANSLFMLLGDADWQNVESLLTDLMPQLEAHIPEFIESNEKEKTLSFIHFLTSFSPRLTHCDKFILYYPPATLTTSAHEFRFGTGAAV